MPSIDANGVSLHYAIAGSGPTLVMLHEMGGSLDSWDAVVPALQQRFRTIRYDQRGAGASEKIRQPFPFETLIDDFDALMTALNIEPPIYLLGVAAGSLQAALIAVRHPTTIAGAALCNPAIGMNATRAAALIVRAEIAERNSMHAVLDLSLDISFPPDSVADRETYDTYRMRYLANDPVSFGLLNRAVAAFDPAGIIEGIACPVLIVAGRDDRVRPYLDTLALAERIPDARTVTVAGGHFLPVQSPLSLIGALAGWP